MAILNIPFAGFYESKYSDLIDHEIEQFGEYENEKQSSEYYPETLQPEELRVDVSEFAWEFVDHSAAYSEIARDYVEAFGIWLTEAAHELDSDAPVHELTFNRMDSPREYNFSTDQIDVEISDLFVQWLFDQSAKNDHAELSTVLERRHKSRSGFISFYSWRLADWLAKPVSDWDYHELRSLLEAVFPELHGETEWDWGIYENLSQESYSYLDKHMNWAKFDAAVIEKRAEKLAQWLTDDEDSALIWRANNRVAFDDLMRAEMGLFATFEFPAAPYRCPETPDLFAGTQWEFAS